MTVNSHGFFRNFEIRETKFNPHLVDAQLVRDTVEGKSILWVRLIETDGKWKLNNVYVEEFNNVDINLWARFIYRALEKRLALVRTASGETDLQRVNDVLYAIEKGLNIIGQVRALSDHGRS